MVEGNREQTRANPLYWLVLLPVAWWAAELSAFEPGSVRAMKLLTVIAPATALLCLLIAVSLEENWVLWLTSFIVSGVTAFGSRMAYRDSLLQREGPSR